jgi:lipopolysaccharide transport system permease protein
MLFYLTPIFYQIQTIPEPYRKIILYSPLAALILGYHDILFFGRAPSATSLAYIFGFGIVLLVAGYTFFNRYRESFGEFV